MNAVVAVRLSLVRWWLIALLPVAAGCAQIPPGVSQTHLGHALGDWKDTPGQRGLLVVAREQADTALRESAAAVAAPQAAQRRVHLAQLATTLDPESDPAARAGGYGLVRALQEAVEHIDYAATSTDASGNLVEAGADIGAAAGPLIDSLRRANTLARSAEGAGDAELAAIASRLDSGLHQLIDGADFNRDGRIGLRDDEAGLAQIEQRLAQATAGEASPTDQPQARQPALGMSRPPGGRSQFLPTSSRSDACDEAQTWSEKQPRVAGSAAAN